MQLIIFLLAFISTSNQAEVKITVGDYPPFVEVYSDQHGFITEKIKSVFEQANIAIDITFSNWDDAEAYVDNANHLSYMWVKNADRKHKWLFSDPIYESKFVFLAKKKTKFVWRYYDDLVKYRIGTTESYNYGERFEYFAKQLKLNASKSDYIGVKKLLNDEVDILAIEQTVAKQILDYFPATKTKDLELVDKPYLFVLPTYLVCSKQYAKCFYYLDKFNDALKKHQSIRQ